LLHHFIVGKKDGLEVDHRDGNGLNDRKSNLRHVTHIKNILNRKYKLSSSVVVGVHRTKERKAGKQKSKSMGKKFISYRQET
jgi:HNH endonuclease